MGKRRIWTLLLALSLCLLPGCGSVAEDDLAPGLAYLERLENRDPQEVEAVLKAYRQQALQAQRAQLLETVRDKETDVWPLFEDYALLGDSRAVGFWYYDYLPDDRVLSAGGATIRNVQGWMEELKALNPSYVYLCFGLNDVSIGYWDTPEEYTAEYLEVIRNLQAELPGVTVIVSSILPARDPAFNRASAWRKIPEYSQAVGRMCQENNIPFADNDAISQELAEYWDPDGIHLRPAFYPSWARNLLIAMYEAQPLEEEVSAP